ncbi:thioesterase [Mesorhizobium sp. M1A.F.Ca.ET.072.01.1.1]|nr:thioesterase [Mesorhizobium sp. M1A.F.Ca.ET.072.01.1.1]
MGFRGQAAPQRDITGKVLMVEIYDPPIPWTGQLETPLTLFRTTVRPEWIDEFEHVSFDRYLTIGSHANWAFWNWINSPEGTMAEREGHESVVVESHVNYIRELSLGTTIHCSSQLIDFDDKRYLLLNQIWKSGGVLAATNELKCLGFNLRTRRAEKWRPKVRERLTFVLDVQGKTCWPLLDSCIALNGKRGSATS